MEVESNFEHKLATCIPTTNFDHELQTFENLWAILEDFGHFGRFWITSRVKGPPRRARGGLIVNLVLHEIIRINDNWLELNQNGEEVTSDREFSIVN